MKEIVLLKNITKLTGANLLGQLISILVMPIITRLHNPASLGEYQFFTTIALLLAPFISGSFGMAIINSSSKEIAINNLKVGIRYSVYTTLFFLTITPILIYFLNNSKLDWFSYYLPLLVLFVFFSVNFQFIISYLNNEKKYEVITKMTFEKSVVSNFLKVFFSIINKTAISLTIALIVTEIFQIYKFIKKNNIKKIISMSNNCFLKELKRNKNYPIHYTGYSVVSILMNWFPVLITGYYYGAHYAGILGLSLMVVNTPIYPIISTLQNICFGELSRVDSVADYLIVYKKIFFIALVPAVAGIVFLFLYGETIFGLFFGKIWSEAGLYAAISYIPISICLIFSPIYSHLCLKMRIQNIFLGVNILIFIFSLISFMIISFSDLGFIYFVISCALFMALNHTILFVISMIYFFKNRKVEVIYEGQ